MKIILEVLPSEKMRYNTQGDWFLDEKGNLIIQSIECENCFYEFLVLVHELVECLDCMKRGVSQKQVDDFDFVCKADDPGSESDAPYNRSHRLATGIENILAAAWGIDWKKYESSLEMSSQNLPENPKCQTPINPS